MSRERKTARAQPSVQSPELVRGLPVPGTYAYVDRLGVPAGEAVRVHVSAPAAFDVDLVRIGTTAILHPTEDLQADLSAERADVEVLATRHHPAAEPQVIGPGSYLYVDGPPIPAGPLSLSTWLRPWAIPRIDRVQWAWAGIISDLDYPMACRFGLLLDHLGRLAVYAGDGGWFRHAWLHPFDVDMRERLGTWSHVVATIDSQGVALFLDGALIGRVDADIPMSAPNDASRLRVGATGEASTADNFLDGDLSLPFVAASALSERDAERLAADLGRSDPGALLDGGTSLRAAWPLDEERGIWARDTSPNGRHARIVNHGTWQVGGPAHDLRQGVPGYEPALDPDRGHGFRLSSDDLVDCEWPITDAFDLEEDAESGTYAARIRLAGQGDDQALWVPFAVVQGRPRQTGAVALVCATNTWLAYGRRPSNDRIIAGLTSSFYSNHHPSGRPFFHVGTRVPIPDADPFGFGASRSARMRHSHLVRPERHAEAWLRKEGFAFEMLTDADLHREPEILAGFAAVLVVGHNEYWSDEMRDGLELYLARGGNLISLSGNTAFYRVSFNEEMTVLESRKAVSGVDDRWLSPDQWGERWHSAEEGPGGAFPFLGRPAWELFALDSQGMIDDGTPTEFAPFTVLAPDHPLFHTPEVVPITSDGTIGEVNFNGPKASGYEFDATPDILGSRDEPLPGCVTLASALGQPNLERFGALPDHGGDIVWWERPAGGRVFAAGSIGVTGSLASDPGIGALVRNVFQEMGVRHREDGP